MDVLSFKVAPDLIASWPHITLAWAVARMGIFTVSICFFIVYIAVRTINVLKRSSGNLRIFSILTVVSYPDLIILQVV